MTRLLINADMEGISGIDRYEQCNRSHPSYQEGVKHLCQEINVIAQAAFESGAQSVSVIDWHGGGGNLDPELLDERVPIVPEDLTPGYDLALLVGFHPMAGDQTGFISHTMTQGVALEVNGTQIGELSLLAWWLAEHGIPIGLVTGDRAATAEADRFFPNTPTHTVKRAESWSRAICVPVEQSFEALKIRVARILQQRERWTIYRPPERLTFRLRLRDDDPFVPLIPWLTADEEGWFSGQVEKTRDLIDLIDVVSAIFSLAHRNRQIANLSEDPGVRERIREFQLQTIAASIEKADWAP